MTIAMGDRRQVGRTGLQMPPLGFGGAHLGELYAPEAEAESLATLHAAWDGGIRYYDTAPWYGRGLSEHRVGGFLRTRRRGEFILTTKVGRILRRPDQPRSFSRDPWAGGLNFEIEFDYSYDGVMRSYEQSLMRLGLDTVDALIVHDLDASHHGERLREHRKMLSGGMRALQELKEAGEISAIGMGINTTEALVEAVSGFDLDFVLVAMPYTLLDQSSLHTGMAGCVERDIGVIVGAPFASGILATGSGGDAKYGYAAAPEDIRKRVKGIEAVCQAHGVALPAAALQFPLAHPAVVSVIPGAARAVEVKHNIAAFAAAIPPTFWSDLKAERLIDAEAPTPG